MTTRVVGDVAVRVGADVGPLKIGLQDGARSVDRFGRGGRQMGQAIRRGAAIAATAITALAGSIAAAASRSIAAMDSIGKKSDQIGIAVEAFQELRFAANSAGVSNEAFTSSMERFSKRLGEAAQGTGAAARALEQMGINAQALADLGVENAFEVIADQIAGMESASERAAAAAALFGREGVAMVNMLRDGSDALRTTRDEARAMGAVIGEDTVRQAEALQDEIGRLKDVISAQFSEALIAAGPLLVSFAEGIANIAQAANDAVSAIGGFVAGIVEMFSRSESELAAFESAMDRRAGNQATRAARGGSNGSGNGGDAPTLGEFIGGLLPGDGANDQPTDRRGRVLSPEEQETVRRVAAQRATEAAAIARSEYDRIVAEAQSDFAASSAERSARSRLGEGGGSIIPEGLELDPEEETGGGGGGGGGIAAALSPTEEDIDAIRSNFQNAADVIREQYAEQLAIVDEYYAQQEGKAEEHAAIRAEIERRMQSELAALRANGIAEALGSTSQMFDSLAQIASSGGEEMLRVSKILSAAQAFVSTLAGAAEALRLPFPANLAAAAQVISTGAGLVAAIKGASPGGANDPRGAGGGAGAAGSVGQAQQQQRDTQNVLIDLVGASERQVDQFQKFADTFNEVQRQGLLANVTVRGL
jgi:hypothetical protein